MTRGQVGWRCFTAWHVVDCIYTPGPLKLQEFDVYIDNMLLHMTQRETHKFKPRGKDPQTKEPRSSESRPPLRKTQWSQHYWLQPLGQEIGCDLNFQQGKWLRGNHWLPSLRRLQTYFSKDPNATYFDSRTCGLIPGGRDDGLLLLRCS